MKRPSKRPESERIMALELNIDWDEKLEQLGKIPKLIRLAVV